MDGVENCLICGQTMNMGFVSIHNPMRELYIWIPFMGLHYMEHGSFSYDGTTNSGRIDIELLKEILAHYDTEHYTVETNNDDDDDGLRDEHEEHFGMQANDPDTDGNQLVDGAQVAEQLIQTISQLPEDCVSFDIAYGLVNCPVCGMAINMGMVTVKNPNSSDSYSFPIPGLHFLAHGRFAYGMQLYPSDPGEVDAVQLAQVLDVLTWAPHTQPRPREHRLNLSNYPNPFNAGTQIEFTLARNGAVALRIYNVQGQLVRTLLDETTAAGHHLIRWDGRDDDSLGWPGRPGCAGGQRRVLLPAGAWRDGEGREDVVGEVKVTCSWGNFEIRESLKRKNRSLIIVLRVEKV
jgi:hypothetical protein